MKNKRGRPRIWKTTEEQIAADRYKDGMKGYWPKKDFVKWFIETPKVCHYCGCTEADIKRFWELDKSKRKRTRGRSMEIDRKEDKPYSRDNCVFACAYCNNAKSDVFTAKEFKSIGATIGKVIKKRINKGGIK